ncbi:MAG: ribonuclease, partial [Gaiellales bacterium]|nr:ribonuclease [Gaiellales bacterium]
MDLDLVFLGTSASAPTANRAPIALLLRRGGERLLFDCAEGTQRQLMRSSVGLPDLEEIFLTHFHADHYLGLPGMLKTFALRQRDVPLTVYGPPGLRDLFGSLGRVFGKLSYPLELVEVRAGEALERDGYRILVFPVHHGVSAVGYALVENP